MAILEAFGLTSKMEKLVGGNVHQYFNILTMQNDLHLLFDSLKFWLEEAIGEENTYTVCSVKDKVFKMTQPLPRRVTFRVDPDFEAACVAKGIPVPALPSPSLLAIRAACSRVAHTVVFHSIDKAIWVDRLLRDLEETPVMAEDGTTAHILASLLRQSSRTVCIEA
ncbi:hypothetical protein GGX14DRAFT_369821 [Mycena pura]|uniref:Uncharacterized protein n=1 Tax=Mycena pura TaxID=153505 RepID=A0AAD6V965_9AGAR|nr:hypothetical protein GGX14DRAFT_369821 [Mycena pura]